MKTLVNLFLISSLYSICGCGQSIDIDSTKNPDLIIESITYKKLPNCFSTYPSGVVCMDGLNLEFTLRIKNIGTAPFAHSLFISNSRSEKDIEIGHYSHGQQPYYDSTLTSHTIDPGQVIEVRVDDIFDANLSKIKFLINDDGKPHIKALKLPPRVEELNYDNNTFDLEFKK